jgi:hypothetical protein
VDKPVADFDLEDEWPPVMLPTGAIPQEAIVDHEKHPEFEVHIGRVIVPGATGRQIRYTTVWIRGKRWRGLLSEDWPG